MSAEWKIVNGQIGNVIEKKNGVYLINIADNKYKPDKNDPEKHVKVSTTWFSCICDYKPRVDKGDTVIAIGTYLESKSVKYPYVMKIDHIGVIRKKQEV